MYEQILNFLKEKSIDVEETQKELFLNYIKIKQKGELYLLYNAMNNRENESDLEKNLKRECNGLIIDKENNIVCGNQYNFETDIFKKEEMMEKGEIKSKEYSEDGTVLRLYNYKEKWYVATKRSIDACENYWSCKKSFSEMFFEIFKYDLSVLDKNVTYMFILISKENMHIIKHKKDYVVYIGQINNNERKEIVYDNIFVSYDYIKYPESAEKEEMKEGKRGVIYKLKDNRMYNIDTEEFNNLKSIRGNTPLLRYRYLELMKEPGKLNDLVNYYDENIMMFKSIEHSVMNISHVILNIYIDTHIKHLYMIGPGHQYYKILLQLHYLYKTNKQPIRYEIVYNHIKSLNVRTIADLLDWKN